MAAQPDNAIVVSDLVVDHETSHGTLRALHCEALSIERGTSLAVVGPSGCGKSTLLGVLAGLAAPTDGSVRIDDIELTMLPDAARTTFRRSRFGVVYQADNLLPFLTIAENVALQLGLSGDTRDLGAEDRAADLLERLGLGALGDRLPDELSGGQRQRAGIARAVVHRPSLILADEPTGALDEANAHGVIELLIDLQHDIGATLVLVTHDTTVAATMQRTIHLAHGVTFNDRESAHVG